MPEYTLGIDLNSLNHLGISLYSNVPAVLSEVVANAWDADAETVKIDIDKAARTITIADDGHGMNVADANERYLRVGYQRRAEGRERTPRFDRPVMGRKGIGKLALFSIANIIEVRSVKRDECGTTEKAGFALSRADIETAIELNQEYHPEALARSTIRHRRGTRLTLKGLKKGLALTDKYLRQRLARRFTILGSNHNFQVYINGRVLGVDDRGYLHHVQYLWFLGEPGSEFLKQCSVCKRHEVLDGVVDEKHGYSVRGWVGTFDERKSIEPGNNTIVVLARGKLVHEDLLPELQEGGIYTKYVIGEIEASFLDRDDCEDILTSDRQHLKEDDPRLLQLRQYLQTTILKQVERQWTAWRQEHSESLARANPAVNEWFESLGGSRKPHARKLFQRIETLRIPDDAARTELYKHGILAFEKLALKESLSLIENLDTEKDFALLKEIFTGIDELEAFEYYHIVRGRIEVLKKFEDIATHAKERVIQEHIFDHLWLLDPSWERASTNPRMEQAMGKEFAAIKANLSKKEKRARIDIRYRTAAGKHIIVELKKYDANVQTAVLVGQVQKYRSALQKCLEKRLPEDPKHIEVVCILGSAPAPHDQANENEQMLRAVGARYITYDTLIQQTRKSYEEYLEADQRIERIAKVIEAL